jgi:cardiolipin synthase
MSFMADAAAQHRLPPWAYPANLLTCARLFLLPAIIISIDRQHFGWALGWFVAAAVSDGLDGWMARHFHQQSRFGEYLDPIADKLLLSSLFVLLSLAGKLPWLVTILVFTRDVCIVVTAFVLYSATHFRDFRPSIWGKLNTVVQASTVGFSLLAAFVGAGWVLALTALGWVLVGLLTYVSGIHYAFSCAARYHQAVGQKESRLAAVSSVRP